MQISAQMCMQRVYVLTEFPFCIPRLVVGFSFLPLRQRLPVEQTPWKQVDLQLHRYISLLHLQTLTWNTWQKVRIIFSTGNTDIIFFYLKKDKSDETCNYKRSAIDDGCCLLIFFFFFGREIRLRGLRTCWGPSLSSLLASNFCCSDSIFATVGKIL